MTRRAHKRASMTAGTVMRNTTTMTLRTLPRRTGLTPGVGQIRMTDSGGCNLPSKLQVYAILDNRICYIGSMWKVPCDQLKRDMLASIYEKSANMQTDINEACILYDLSKTIERRGNRLLSGKDHEENATPTGTVALTICIFHASRGSQCSITPKSARERPERRFLVSKSYTEGLCGFIGEYPARSLRFDR